MYCRGAGGGEGDVAGLFDLTAGGVVDVSAISGGVPEYGVTLVGGDETLREAGRLVAEGHAGAFEIFAFGGGKCAAVDGVGLRLAYLEVLTHVVTVFFARGCQRCRAVLLGEQEITVIVPEGYIAVLGVDGGIEAAGVNLEFAAPFGANERVGQG